MGNTAILSGGEKIAKAKELFFQSLAAEKPDYRFLVLAIGSSPATPPSWAMWECRIEYERTLRRASSHEPAHDEMLDEIARAYIEEMVRREENIEFRDEPVPSFRKMVRRAYSATYGREFPKARENDAYKIYQRKWKDEQQKAAIKSTFNLFDLEITPRIEAILNDYVGTEMDLFPDPARAAFIMQALAKATPEDN
ncbi:MAG: hypothetical protein ABJN35_14455 [Erythrobacter sp.]